MWFAPGAGVLFGIVILGVTNLAYAYQGAPELKLPQLRVAVEHLVSASLDADGGIDGDQGPNLEK
ncbi:hypothetical protein AAVH_29171, partial [Aphelenchoides avenae]